MRFSVVIPVWNGEATIGRVLRALRPQLLPSDELMVVDDGSTDGTAAEVRREPSSFGGNFRVLQQPQRGAAAARNAGLAAAAGDVVLFLGADILPSPHLLTRHRSVHLQCPEDATGCVGLVTWDPLLPPTPFMVWLEHGGPQNAYGEVAGASWVDLRRYCYGANISFKRSFLRSVGGFDAEHFRTYGWEDLDLGIRLAQYGGRLFYEPSARATHLHRYSLPAWERRQALAGASFVTLVGLHPTERVIPAQASGWRYRLRRLFYRSPLGFLLRALAHSAESRWILPRLYSRVSGWVFTESVHRALTR